MRRVFYPYTEWEDYKAGMFSDDWTDIEIQLSKQILSDPDLCLSAMASAVKAYPKSAEHNLTAMGTNRRAWVGQAACFYAVKSPEGATKSAWWFLTDANRDMANGIADQVIDQWEEGYCYAETLF
jgi:hypothetical protein